MAATSTLWTAEMVRQLPDDGNRYELVDGELLVSPAPRSRHQQVIARLFRQVANYIAAWCDPDVVLFSPADISWNDHVLVQPDLFIVHPEEVRGEWADIKRLLWVVEVVSPSSVRADYVLKRDRYLQAGVAEYWIVDPTRREVQIWRPGDTVPAVATTTLTWHPHPALGAPSAVQPLTVDLAALFRE